MTRLILRAICRLDPEGCDWWRSDRGLVCVRCDRRWGA